MLPSPDTLSVTLRALGWMCLFQALGGTFFVVLFKLQMHQSRVYIQRWITAAATAGTALILLHLSFEATRMTGDYASFLDSSMQRLAWHSSSAMSHLMQVAGLLILIFSTARNLHFISLLGATCIVIGFITVGHVHAHPWKTLLMPLLGMHVLIVAFWFGSLLPLYMVIQHETLATARYVLERFSIIATWAVPCIALIGVIMVLMLADGIPDITRGYGALVFVKGIGFIILMGFAAINKWTLVPAMGSASASRTHLRRSLLMEGLLIAGVLAVTAALTTFYSPDEG